jgi:WD40 repeat protein
VTGYDDGVVRLWDAADGARGPVLRGHREAVYAVAFSPRGDRVITGSTDTTARVWSAATGRELADLPGGGGIVNHAEFSPDGRFAVTAAAGGTVRIWDLDTARSIATVRMRPRGTAAFAPHGRDLLLVAADGPRIYRCEVCASYDDLLAVARRRAGRALSPAERARYLRE